MEKKSIHKEKSKMLFLEAFDEIIQPNVANLAPVLDVQTKAVVVKEQAGTYQVRYRSNAYGIPEATKAITISSVKKRKESAVRFSYSDIDVIESARNGIQFNDFKNIYDLMKLSNSKWSEIIGISERTMQTIIKEKKDFDQNKSEKLLSFLTLIEYAISVLGNEKNVEEWLHYKSPSLAGKAPIDYVDTFQGIQMLHEQLFKIETGNLV